VLRFLDDTGFASIAAPFVEHGVLELVDVHAVDLIAGAFDRPSPEVQLALALAIRAPRHGHVGVDLHSVAGSIVVETPADTDGDAPERVDFPWPENATRWFDDTCSWLSAVGGIGEVAGPVPLSEDISNRCLDKRSTEG